MRQYLVIVGFACLVAAGGIDGRALTKRQADSSLDPNLQEIDSDDNLREKRHQDLGFGVKNALLGFVFGKINSFIDQKTQWVNQLDHQNIIKNKQHNIVSPGDPVVSLSSAISGVIGQKIQAAGPLIGVVVQKVTSGSGGLSGGSGGFNIGSLLGGLSGGVTTGAAGAGVEAQAGIGAYSKK